MARTPIAARPGSTISLRFSAGPGSWRSPAAVIAGSVSGVVRSGRCLFVSSDQTATVERLTADDTETPSAYRDHLSYRLNNFVTLPQRGREKDTEVDLEGIDVQWLGPDTGYLWLIGSHSWARGQVKKKATVKEAIKSLESVDLDRNRRVLLRIPVIVGGDGLPQLVASCPDPTDKKKAITAGLLGDLAGAMAKDDHLKPFMPLRRKGKKLTVIPGKDNGLDVEGLAVTGDGRVYVGLRGPVLRGWAVVLELRVETAGTLKKGQRLRLPADGEPFRKHFLDLGGLGVRELFVDGDDLVVLAGPTMMLDGPVRLLRWPGGATAGSASLVRSDDLQLLYQLPYGNGDDHPEGFTRIGTGNTARLLLVYDSPAGPRQPSKDEVLADLFPWP
jgi:hypothetical protein